MREPIRRLTLTELEGRLQERGHRPFRARQILSWVYAKRVRSFQAMTNLSKGLRTQLAQDFSLAAPKILEVQRAEDGTAKYLLELADGQRVESVFMPGRPRPTVCVSTQVGCRMGCRFCATGRLGLLRQLRAEEILDQLLTVTQGEAPGERPGVVLMGMGEPLDNLPEVLRALEIMVSSWGADWSHRNVTLGTVGLIPELRQLGGSGLRVNLTISLNAADQDTRASIMPVAHRYPLGELVPALKGYPLEDRQRITIAYVLLAGINDRLEDAKRLKGLLHGIRCKVNLIPFNPMPSLPYQAPDPEQVLRFQEILVRARYSTFLRKPRGDRIAAACGQLHAAYGLRQGSAGFPGGPHGHG